MIKFTRVSQFPLVTPGGVVVIYYIALDNHGNIWRLDSGQLDQEWKPMPPHPWRDSSSGTGP